MPRTKQQGQTAGSTGAFWLQREQLLVTGAGARSGGSWTIFGNASESALGWFTDDTGVESEASGNGE